MVVETSFNKDAAKKFLSKKEQDQEGQREVERKALLNRAEQHLKERFKNTPVEVYLVGSITQPFKFYSHSDIDIVVKNF